MGDLPPIALYCSLIFGVRFLEMYGPCARATTATHSTTITTSRTDDDAGSLEDVFQRQRLAEVGGLPKIAAAGQAE